MAGRDTDERRWACLFAAEKNGERVEWVLGAPEDPGFPGYSAPGQCMAMKRRIRPDSKASVWDKWTGQSWEVSAARVVSQIEQMESTGWDVKVPAPALVEADDHALMLAGTTPVKLLRHLNKAYRENNDR